MSASIKSARNALTTAHGALLSGNVARVRNAVRYAVTQLRRSDLVPSPAPASIEAWTAIVNAVEAALVGREREEQRARELFARNAIA